MSSELDEQGLQAFALTRSGRCEVGSVEDVSICSPFHPGVREFGHCGAHFVGLNPRHIPWDYYDRSADLWMKEHWTRSRAALSQKIEGPMEQVDAEGE